MKEFIHNTLFKLKGIDHKKYYKEISQINSQSELINFKEKNLKNLLLHAYKNVPYYHKIFNKIRLVSHNSVNLSKFDDIPLLTKKIIRSQFKSLIPKDYNTRKWHYNSSGGSTGEPVRFIQDNNYHNWRIATNKYYYQDILGIDEINCKKILLWGSERDIFKGSIGIKANVVNWLTNTILLNTFKISEKDMAEYTSIINSYKPELIRGYAGSLYEFSKYIERKKISIYKPKILISAAETLNKEMRKRIEHTFKIKLYDFYGSREASSLAGECNCGLMHMFMFNNHIELLDKNNKPVKDGEEGRIIVTNLHNYSMPLIRYDIGDMAILGPKKCKCGNYLPTLKKITGRITDHFVKKDGTIIPAEFFIHLIGVVCNKGFIEKFQVIQENYNKIKILVIPIRKISNLEKKHIDEKIMIVMGKKCKIDWHIVDNIPKTKSGKYLYTQSLVYNR